jgi:hypothetical protein
MKCKCTAHNICYCSWQTPGLRLEWLHVYPRSMKVQPETGEQWKTLAEHCARIAAPDSENANVRWARERTDLGEKTLWSLYMTLRDIERAFRCLKDRFCVPPGLSPEEASGRLASVHCGAGVSSVESDPAEAVRQRHPTLLAPVTQDPLHPCGGDYDPAREELQTLPTPRQQRRRAATTRYLSGPGTESAPVPPAETDHRPPVAPIAFYSRLTINQLRVLTVKRG